MQLLRRIKSQLVRRIEARRFPSPSEILSYISYARSTVVNIENYLDKFTSLEGDQRDFIVSASNQYQEYKKSSPLHGL